MRITRRLSVAAAAAVLATSCGTDEGNETPVDQTTISSSVVGGELLCEFVPRQSAALALGSDDVVEMFGQVPRDSAGEIASASCRIGLDGQDEPALSVAVDWALGSKADSFEDGLRSDAFHQLPDDHGLGYSWTEDADRPDGSRGPTSRAVLLHGDRLIDVSILQPADGRDAEADAVAIARQVTQTLELSDEWTLGEVPPSR
jgi:hypothetical protein